MIRPVARLIADVTEFMTLAPGDVLLLGVAAGAPRARAGQRVAIEIDGARAAREPPRRGRGGGMKRARVAYAGAIHEAVPHDATACAWPTAACVAERRRRLAAAVRGRHRSSRSA